MWADNLDLYHIELCERRHIGDFLKVTLAFAAAADLTQLSLGIDKHQTKCITSIITRPSNLEEPSDNIENI